MVALYGAAMAGAVVVPVVHFYGPKELQFILDQLGAKVHLTTASFGSSCYLDALDGFRSEVATLEHVVLVGEGSAPWVEGFAAIVEAAPIAELPSVDPMAPAIVGYTSGTTSDPKGVVHVANSFVAEALQMKDYDVGASRPLLTGAPLAHTMGMIGGAVLPLMRHEPSHLVDRWEPDRVPGDHGGSGALLGQRRHLLPHQPLRRAELHAAPRGAHRERRPRRIAGTGRGVRPRRSARCRRSPLVRLDRAPDVDRRASAPTRPSTASTPRADRSQVARSASSTTRAATFPTAPSVRSSAVARNFLRLRRRRADRPAIDADGWYHSEDLAVRDDDGYITIADRKKDIIIRGGENVSASEVEEILLGMPGVSEVAVVAAPDARLGEHGCAFVAPRPGNPVPSLDEVRAYFDAAGVARQKWPEELRSVDQFPRTPSGKIKKQELREQLRREASASRR